MKPDDCPELAPFLRGELDPGGFTHREHVRMAYELLLREEFADAVPHYSRALRAMLAKAGRPEAFNLTVTIAFLSIIAERMQRPDGPDFAAFASTNADLLEKGALARWYRPERLASPAARRAFLMPDPAWGDGAPRTD